MGAAILFAAVLVLDAWSAASYVAAAGWVDHTLEVRQEAYEWLTSILDAETGARGFVASGEPLFLEPYEQALTRERAKAALMRELVADNPAQAENVEAADRDAQVVMDHLRELVALVRAGHRDEALLRLAGGLAKEDMDVFRGDSRRVRSAEDALLQHRRSQTTTRGQVTLGGGVLLTLLSFGLIAVGWRREYAHDAAVTTLARDARGRLRALSELATALADARSASQVADVVIEQGVRAVGADTCTLYLLDETGAGLDLVGHRGVAPEMIEKIRRIDAQAGKPTHFTAAKTGTAVWVENDFEYGAIFPELASRTDRRAHAFWSVPLEAEDSTIGLLGMGFYEARAFPADERTFVGTLANQCAQALLRAARLQREDELRRWLSTTLRSIGDAVIATDARGRVTFMNPVAESLTGWTEGDARGRGLDDVFAIFSEETHQPVESPVTRVLREGAVVGLANHTVLRSKRGIEVPIDDSGAPIRGEDGRIVGVVLVFRDVTRDKRQRVRSEFLSKAGEVLASSLDYENTLSTVARLAVPTIADWCAIDLVEPGSPAPRQVAVAHSDPGKVQLARELGRRYPPDPNGPAGAAHAIRTGESRLHAEIDPSMLEAAAIDAEHLRLMRDLRLESAMVVALRWHGRIFGAMTLVYAESGRRYGTDDLAFAEDFARRAAMAIENALALKEAEDGREREQWLRREAELANRSKDDFLATVSHELRTPLNSILGWTVTLRGRKPPDGMDRALAIVERNARAQAKLIDDVLDVSRVISGKLALNMGPTNVAQAVAAAIETASPAALNKSIIVQSEVEDESLTITADADRLQQIVWNLLSNAVKFTPKGGRILVRAYRNGSNACLSVSDTGEGIRPEALPLIFEPFRQADASTTRRHGGLGLGLAIVKQLVSAHGGSVQARSEGPGKGATFIVEVPARSAVQAVCQEPPPSIGSPPPLPSVKTGPRLNGLCVLVVDDEEDALVLLRETLSACGAEVHVASCAAQAIDTLAEVRPDVFVSDIGMPDVDGYALIRKVRALPPEAGGRIPAVALTAYARPEDAQRAFVAGFQMHVTKPVEPAHLATVVANLGGRSLDDA